ncbi:hypothetical protein K439DRAFT_340758 [Ramaria rubella]|nr:hypothetical protein K439DRAFT_340758 [Ramaria rubella]
MGVVASLLLRFPVPGFRSCSERGKILNDFGLVKVERTHTIISMCVRSLGPLAVVVIIIFLRRGHQANKTALPTIALPYARYYPLPSIRPTATTRVMDCNNFSGCGYREQSHLSHISPSFYVSVQT